MHQAEELRYLMIFYSPALKLPIYTLSSLLNGNPHKASTHY
jgi:hypothetical protein